ncbi:MAG: hypothetical protein H7Y12_02990 [Sphingobacteriaceae bacterium]|nr:hypothetical protein [Cytophagaceae bacterium]
MNKPKVVTKRIVIPPMQEGTLNVYNSEQIQAAGGLEAFNTLIGNDKPKIWPTIEFTDDEWKEMLKKGLD